MSNRKIIPSYPGPCPNPELTLRKGFILGHERLTRVNLVQYKKSYPKDRITQDVARLENQSFVVLEKVIQCNLMRP